MSHDNGTQARRGFLVSGRVQGVGFRFWTVRTARELRLTGTVRNRPDGRVEVHAAGDEKAVDDLAGRLRRGPRSARVESVEEIPGKDDLPDDFRVVF